MKDLVKFFGNESVKLVGNQGFCIRIDAEEERDEIGRIFWGESYYLRLENTSITRTWDKDKQALSLLITSGNDLRVYVLYSYDRRNAYISIQWSDSYELKYGSDYALPSYDKQKAGTNGWYYSHRFNRVESISLEFAE